MWQDSGWPWKGKTPKDCASAGSDPGHMVKSHMTVIDTMGSYEEVIYFMSWPSRRLLFSRAQARVSRFAPGAACGPRGGQGCMRIKGLAVAAACVPAVIKRRRNMGCRFLKEREWR